MSYTGPAQPSEREGLDAPNWQSRPMLASQLLHAANTQAGRSPPAWNMQVTDMIVSPRPVGMTSAQVGGMGGMTLGDRDPVRQYQSASGTPGDSWLPPSDTEDMATLMQQQHQLLAMHSLQLKQEQQADQQLGGAFSYRQPPPHLLTRHTMDGSMHMWGQQQAGQSGMAQHAALPGMHHLAAQRLTTDLTALKPSVPTSRLSEPGNVNPILWQGLQATASGLNAVGMDEHSSESGGSGRSAGGSTLRHGQHLLASKAQSPSPLSGSPPVALHAEGLRQLAQRGQRPGLQLSQQQAALQGLMQQIEKHQLQLRAKNNSSTTDTAAEKGSTSQAGTEKQPVSHSNVEKQRRDRINALIEELRTLVSPMSSEEPGVVRRAKHAVLADTITMIRNIQDALPQLAEAMVAQQQATVIAGALTQRSQLQPSSSLSPSGGPVQAPQAKLGLSVIQEPGGLCVQVLCRTRPVSDVIKALSVLPIEVVAIAPDGEEQMPGG